MTCKRYWKKIELTRSAVEMKKWGNSGQISRLFETLIIMMSSNHAFHKLADRGMF